jgi:hypothetical protein
MMQAADLREGENDAGRGRLYRPRLGAILAEREMRAASVVILKVCRSCGHAERLGGKPFVTIMEATHRWERDDLTGLGWEHRAALRTILVD